MLRLLNIQGIKINFLGFKENHCFMDIQINGQSFVKRC